MSTERASLGLEPPMLHSDVLAVQKKAKAVIVEARDQAIETAGLGEGEGAGVVRAAGVPGIDDGGETRTMAAPRPVSIPSDGRPHRVPLWAFETAAQTELVLMAEIAAAVVTRSTSTNASEHPILAGPVDLVRDAGFVGRTSVLFVAPGEKLELGWGPVGALRVQREIETLKQESSILGNWVTAAHDVKVRISNLGAAPKRVRVVERVPVSEVEKVQIAVERESTTGGKQPDADGMLTWDLPVPGDGHETVTLRVVVKKHADVQGV
jgi:uncharacterized protein (TIGR02231 family)